MLKKLITILFILCLLSACNAAITSAQVAYNRDKLEKTVSDNYIATVANKRLFRDTTQFDGTHISVTTFRQIVLLTGQIPTKELRDHATKIVKTIPGVKKVYNLTENVPPAPPLSRIGDGWITAKIKAKLLMTQDVDPDQIQVVTEHGNVFLMGMILKDQADIIVDIAKNTEGVQNVIKILTLLEITKA